MYKHLLGAECFINIKSSLFLNCPSDKALLEAKNSSAKKDITDCSGKTAVVLPTVFHLSVGLFAGICWMKCPSYSPLGRGWLQMTGVLDAILTLIHTQQKRNTFPFTLYRKY